MDVNQRATYADNPMISDRRFALELAAVASRAREARAECSQCKKRREIGMAKFEARKERERKS